eukprot:15447052-Alexandrium_andersonii.AAC.1
MPVALAVPTHNFGLRATPAAKGDTGWSGERTTEAARMVLAALTSAGYDLGELQGLVEALKAAAKPPAPQPPSPPVPEREARHKLMAKLE